MGFLHNLWTNPGPDSGWSWVVALSSCWIQFQMLWIVRSSGFLFTAVIQMFGVSREEAAVPFAVYAFSVFFPGFCSGISITPLTVLLSHYFVKSRTTANGICLAGRSICGFVIPPIVFLLLNIYGLRGTCLLMGAIMSNSLIAASLLRPRNRMNFPERLACDDRDTTKSFIEKETDRQNIALEEVNESSAEMDDHMDVVVARNFPKRKKEPCEPTELAMTSKNVKAQSVLKRFSMFAWNCLKILKDPVYILTVTSDTFYLFSNITFLLLLVDYLMDIGFSKEFSVVVLIVQSVSDLFARIFSGFITDRGYLTRQASISITFFVYGVTFSFLNVFNVSYLFVFNSILYGFFGGCTLINITAFYSQHLTREDMPVGIGLSCTFKGFSFLLQSALIGYFRDQIGSYVGLFYLLSSVAFVFSSLWLLLTLKMKWQSRNSLRVRETDNERNVLE